MAWPARWAPFPSGKCRPRACCARAGLGADGGAHRMKRRVAVLQFPGVNCEAESERALAGAGLAAERIPWAAPVSALESFDAYLLPGGFSYQDRVRAGAIAARHAFLDVVRRRAERGTPVL